MAEKSYVWDGILTGDAIYSPYSADEWSYYWRQRHGAGAQFPNYGVLKGTGDGSSEPLTVNQVFGGAAAVEVQPGFALVHGRLYELTATATLSIAANASGNPRIDTVILRLDNTAQTIRLVVKQGTAAASPVAPSLTQTDGTLWEIPLANIAVANGFSTILNANITPRQRSVNGTPAFWQPYAYPLGYVPNGNYDSATFDLSSSGAVALPVIIHGNMLVDSITIRRSTDLTYNISWGLYAQDTNEGQTAENTLKRVAFGSASGSTSGAAASNLTVAANPAPQPVAPGFYWLVIKTTTDVLRLGVITASTFQAGVNTFTAHTTTISSLTQTLNMVTGWSAQTSLMAARINGRVFGSASAF